MLTIAMDDPTNQALVEELVRTTGRGLDGGSRLVRTEGGTVLRRVASRVTSDVSLTKKASLNLIATGRRPGAGGGRG